MANTFSGRFNGRVAVVTGGASGIGAAVVARLAAEGAQVHALDRDVSRLAALQTELRNAGHTIDVAATDITDEAAVRSAFADVVSARGKLDVLVHSAGVVGPSATNIVDYPLAEFEKTVRVNLTGGFLCTKYAVTHMAPRGYGRILMVASIAGKDGNPGMVGYTASKAGLIGLVKGVGKEYAPSGITVNGLAPAVISTPMNADTSPQQMEYMLARIPMKRMGTVDEVAALITWAVSEEASFCTGFIFDTSGGRAVY